MVGGHPVDTRDIWESFVESRKRKAEMGKQMGLVRRVGPVGHMATAADRWRDGREGRMVVILA